MLRPLGARFNYTDDESVSSACPLSSAVNASGNGSFPHYPYPFVRSPWGSSLDGSFHPMARAHRQPCTGVTAPGMRQLLGPCARARACKGADHVHVL